MLKYKSHLTPLCQRYLSEQFGKGQERAASLNTNNSFPSGHKKSNKKGPEAKSKDQMICDANEHVFLMYTAAVYALKVCVWDGLYLFKLHFAREASGETSTVPFFSLNLLLFLCSTPLCPSSTSLPLLTFLCLSARKSKSQHDFLSGSHFGPKVLSLRSTAALMGQNEARRSPRFPLLDTPQNHTYSIT